MTHAAAHRANTHHGFIQMHLEGQPTKKLADQAAVAVNAAIGAGILAEVQNATAVDGTVLVYVEFADPPAPWNPRTVTHEPANSTTAAHDRVLALRYLIARNVSKPNGTPFFDFGLSHNWCCYGDE